MSATNGNSGWLTIEQLADHISKGLPGEQSEMNLMFLYQVHGLLKEGAVWIWPKGGEMWKKEGAGFRKVTRH